MDPSLVRAAMNAERRTRRNDRWAHRALRPARVLCGAVHGVHDVQHFDPNGTEHHDAAYHNSTNQVRAGQNGAAEGPPFSLAQKALSLQHNVEIFEVQTLRLSVALKSSSSSEEIR